MNASVIAFASDFHFGSTCGPMPPIFTLSEGLSLNANAAQVWLWSCLRDSFETWLPSIVRGRPWALIINGDTVDGRHHDTFQIIHPDIEVHKRLACETLASLLPSVRDDTFGLFFVRGTETHGRTIEDEIGRELRATPDPSTGAACFEQLRLRVGGNTLISIKHHRSGSLRPWCKSNTLSSILAAEQLNALKCGHAIPRIVVRGHAHEYAIYRGSEGMSIALPPWQLTTRYGLRASPEFIPTPGLVVMDFDDMQSDKLPAVHTKLYVPTADPEVVL